MEAYEFDPITEFGLDIPRKDRKQALADAAEYLKTAMLDYIGEGKSPVTGKNWKGLSPEYKKRKLQQSGSSIANLELSGEMLDSLTVDVSGSSIIIDVGDDQRDKATGHLTGEYGKYAKTSPRKFMPQGNESFSKKILEELATILEEYENA